MGLWSYGPAERVIAGSASSRSRGLACFERFDRYPEPLCRGLAFFEKPDLEWRTLREDCVQLL